MEQDSTTSGPFGQAARLYRDAGWRGTLPLGREPNKKFPPPGDKRRGITFTGHGAPDPSPADIQAWLDGPEARFNIGLRLPPGVIGLDVDAYGTKRGAESLATLIAAHGPLPPTWITSARTDGVSGIRLYRVPTEIDGREINWPGEAGKHIEIIQTGHRYAVVWPSTNPEADNAQYVWRMQTGEWHGLKSLLVPLGEKPMPAPGDLPWLPESWIRGLMLDYDRTEKADLGSGEQATYLAELRDGAPCPPVVAIRDRGMRELAEVDGSRHETARDVLAALVRMGGEGHRGAREAAAAVGAAFVAAVGEERALAGGELQRLAAGAVRLAAADNPEPRQACAHDPLPAYTGPEGFDLAASLTAAFERAHAEHREAAVAAGAEHRSQADRWGAEIEALPFPERADHVRRHIPEIETWAEADQGYARDLLTSKSQLSDLGVTEFGKLIRAAAKERKAAEAEAVRLEAHARHTEAVERARTEGTLLPPPHAPYDVAHELAGRMDRPARWWRGDFYRWDGARYHEWRPEAVEHWVYGQTGAAWFESGKEDGTVPWRPDEAKVSKVLHALSRHALYRDAHLEPDDAGDEIACTNGVLRVSTGELMPHTPERFNLQAVPFPFAAGAECPTWRWFLNDVLPPDAQAFLQEWIGYLLSGRTDLEKIAHLKGLPRSGKGTIAHVIEQLIGPENVASPSMPGLVGTFGEQPLIGKSLAIFSDISWQFRDIAEGVEILKKISGQDTRDVNRKNREAWHGRLGVRFMIMGNDMPRFVDASGALAGRLIHIEFAKSVAGREDPTLKPRLLAELSGILNWALEGLRRLNAAGRFTVPESSRELASEVRRQQGPVQGFLDDCCTFTAEANPIPLEELHPVYQAWARGAGVTHVLDRERFSQALGSAGLRIERKMINGHRARRVYGITSQIDAGRPVWSLLMNPLAPVADLGPAPPVPV